MVSIRVLKRKDGASLVAGVALGIITANFVAAIVQDLAQKISYSNKTGYMGQGWQVAYLFPLVLFALELIALEIVVRVYVMVHDSMK